MGEGSLHPHPKGWGIRDPPRSLCIKREALSVAREMVEEEQNVRAILLECSCLPPYARAIQKAIELPVFDYVTMINYVHSALVKESFEGKIRSEA